MANSSEVTRIEPSTDIKSINGGRRGEQKQIEKKKEKDGGRKDREEK